MGRCVWCRGAAAFGLVLGCPEAQIVFDRAHNRDRARYEWSLQVPRRGWDGPSQQHDTVDHLEADVSDLMLVERLPDLIRRRCSVIWLT
jgi:hypothetical protein